MTASVAAEALLRERLTAQMLAGPPARSAPEVATRLLAIQGQDPRGARLAIRARSTGLSAAAVDRALTEERSLVITWLNRGTLHLVHSEDYPWLHALTTPPLRTANARRLEQEGVSPSAAERGVATIERSLAEHGPLTQDQLRERVAAAGIPTAGQALIHILLLAAIRGLIVRGPMAGKRHAYVLTRDWLEHPAPVDRERALAELARRYLVGHGPAAEHDLARWAGLPLRDVRAGVTAIASALEPRADGLLALRGQPEAAPLPSPRLLGAFEPLLLGWRVRGPFVASHEPRVVSGGIFRPIALVRGRAVATWALGRDGVELEPFGRLARRDAAALETDGAEVMSYLGR